MARMLIHDRTDKAYWADDDNFRLAALYRNNRTKNVLKRVYRRRENRAWKKDQSSA